MISPDILPAFLEMARWFIVRLFIFMGLLSLFPTILVLLLEPVIIALRSFNKSSTTPASSAASSRATTPSSSRLPSRNPSRSPSLSRKPHHRHHHHNNSPHPSAPASPALRDITRDSNSGAGLDKQGFAVPVPVPAALAVNAAAVSSVSNIVDGMVTHRKVNPGAIAASLPSSPQLSSF